MNVDELKIILKNEPTFRIKQAVKAVFEHLVGSWDEATDLPLALRQKLQKELPLEITAQTFYSPDKQTIKALIQLSDGLEIESVLMRHKGRNTVCVSSEVGCPIGCSFCATGKMGFRRNLASHEIVRQVLFFSRLLKPENQRLDNVVFMGMGEPFLNYEQVMEAIGILNSEEYFNIGARKISISTVGVVDGIKKLARDPRQVNLAISLHAPTNALRSKMIPLNKRFPIEDIMAAVKKYLAITGRKVMFEYIMIDRLNDREEEAVELARLLKQIPRHLQVVNLIAYNPTGAFRPSPPEVMKKFRVVLARHGVTAVERYRFGQGIRGACGQLAGRGKTK
jgi:23S rRNA (adenine2503-C2)-methyltransferase